MMKTYSTYVWTFLFLSLFACSKSGDDGDVESQISVEEIDPELVGNWVGFSSGSFGDTNFELLLAQNGGAGITTDNPDFCVIPDLKWFVLNNRFKMEGRDECHRSFVKFDAAYSNSNMTGAWNSSSGNSGSFTITKQ